MYHVNHSGEYTKLNWLVDDGLIPDELLALRFNNEADLPVINRDGYVVSPDTVLAEEVSDEEQKPGDVGRASVEAEYTIVDAVRDFKVIVKKLLKV